MILIAGVGYPNLRDMSLGPVLIERLQPSDWPQDIEIADLSYGPIGVLQDLDNRAPYERLIFVAGVKRNRPPGTLHCYRWKHQLPSVDEIQAQVAEATMDVMSLENLLVIAAYFGKLPRDAVVIEVEALDDTWGEGLAPVMEAGLEHLSRGTPRYVDTLLVVAEPYFKSDEMILEVDRLGRSPLDHAATIIS